MFDNPGKGVRKELNALLKLQDVDTRLAQVERRLRMVPGRLDKLSTRTAAAEQALHEAQGEFEVLDKRRRSAEADIDDAEQKLRKYQGQLAEVKTNEQYQALLHEIALLKEKVSGWEDEVLECMEAVDEGHKKERDLKARLAEQKQDASVKRSHIEAEKRELMQVAAELHQRRSAVTEDLPEELVATYERIKKGKGGVAIAAVEGDTCSVCHGFIPPQHIAEVKKAAEVYYCHNCGRILVWANKATPE